MHRNVLLLSLIALLSLSAASTQAAIVTYSASPDSLSQFYQAGFGFTRIQATAPTLTATISDVDQFKLIYTAPAGFRYRVNAPPSGSTSMLGEIWITNGQSDDFVESGATYVLGGLTGTAPTLSNQGFTGFAGSNDNGKFRAGITLDVPGSFEFTSLEMLFEVPTGYGNTFTDASPELRGFVVVTDFDGPSPLPLIELVAIPAIPEPASLGILALGAAALVLPRRRLRCHA